MLCGTGAPWAGVVLDPAFPALPASQGSTPARHIAAHLVVSNDDVRGDDASTEATRRFYDEYTAVMDLPADFYLQTVQRVFQDHALPRGVLTSRDRRVDPAAIERTALLTIEGERDDICPPGQTAAARALGGGRPVAKRAHHLQANGGHNGLF